MIFQIINLILIDVQFKKLVLDAKKFFSLDHELKVKILNSTLKFVNKGSIQFRSKKIDHLIKKMTQFHTISLKSHKTIVKRLGKLIIISKAYPTNAKKSKKILRLYRLDEYFNSIIFCEKNEDKAKIAEAMRVEIMIDDKEEVLKEFPNSIKTILFKEEEAGDLLSKLL